MSRETESKEQLLQYIDDLELRLEEAEETIRAIHNGEVDAIYARGPEGDQIFTLKGADRTYRKLIEDMNQGAVTAMADGTIVYANKAFSKMVQAPPELIVGDSIYKYIAPENKSIFEFLFQQGIQERTGGEIALNIDSGSPLPVYISMNTILLEGEEVLCIAVTDLTEQKRQEKLVRSERLSRTILEVAGEAIVVCDNKGRIIRANNAAQRLAETPVMLKFFDDLFQIQMIPENNNDKALSFSVLQVLERGTFQRKDVVLRKQNREDFNFLLSAAYLRNKENIIGCVIILTDITELKRLKTELEAEKEMMVVTLLSIGDGVITTDMEGRVTLMNQVAESLTGWPQKEAIGRSLEEVFRIVKEKTREPCENPVEKVLQRGKIVGLANDTVLISSDGTERIIADSGAPIRNKKGNIIGVVLVFRDITDKLKMEKEFLRNQKLESLGILAGGIAHDFNNILTAIIGNASMARMRTVPEDDIFPLLSEVEIASTRAQMLTKQLLTFAKGGTPVKEIVSIKDIIKETSLFALRGSNSNCEFSIAEDLWTAWIDIGQINQVINNVVINANQAMPDGGTIRVEAENMIIDDRHGTPLSPGKYIRISIKDQGEGIREKHLSKVFDPYFTTKQAGSGLGLATSFSIIRNHYGHITAESLLGVGTIVHIYLPASEKAVVKKEEALLIKGKGRVLVMDDEAQVRKAFGSLLKFLGYESECAKDGVEAIEMYKEAVEAQKPYDAVILDLTVPGGMGGKDAVKKLSEIEPEVKAIVSSGYSDDPVLANFQEYGFKGVLTKPFELQLLGKVLQEVLKGGKELS